MNLGLQPLQYLLLVLVGFAISRVYLRLRDGSISFPTFAFWMVLFFLAGVAVIDPLYLTYVALKLGIGRGVDVALYTSVILLFYLIFRTNVMLENLRHELTELVRKLALQELKRQQSSSRRKKSK